MNFACSPKRRHAADRSEKCHLLPGRREGFPAGARGGAHETPSVQAAVCQGRRPATDETAGPRKTTPDTMDDSRIDPHAAGQGPTGQRRKRTDGGIWPACDINGGERMKQSAKIVVKNLYKVFGGKSSEVMDLSLIHI